MSEERQPNLEDTEIGIIGDPVQVVVISIPIGKYADDEKDGRALVYGKMREAQAQVMKILIDLQKKKALTKGLIKPNGLNLA